MKNNLNINNYGLIGKNINYSLSKKIFEKIFIKNKLYYNRYNLYNIKDINNIIDIIHKDNLKGFNVTIPYKISILPLLNEIDNIANSVGSVNTIIVDEKSKYMKGYNTDIDGFMISFQKLLKYNIHKKALILGGTGGVGKAISFVLDKLLIPYKIVSRKKNKNTISYNDINKNTINEYNIIINATPIGTYPNIDACPNIPYKYLNSNNYLYDLVYNPKMTLFIYMGKRKKCTVQNGLDMLKIQAKISWNIWNKI